MIALSCISILALAQVKTVDVERASVVQVEARMKDHEPKIGTGFLWLDQSHVATAYHVVAGACGVVVYTTYPKPTNRRAELALIDAASDLAILAIEKPISEGAPFSAGLGRYDPDGSLHVLGYPLGVRKSDRTPVVAKHGPRDMPTIDDLATSQIRASLHKLGFPALKTRVINLDGNLAVGHSGGPLIQGGKLIGVVAGGISDGEFGRSWAVPVDALRKVEDTATDYSDCNKGLFRAVDQGFALAGREGNDPSVPNGWRALSSERDLGWAVRAEDISTGIVFVLIRPGHFRMGSRDSEGGARDEKSPVARVVITRAFYMSETEVTRSQWAVMNGLDAPSTHGLNPQCLVSWTEAMNVLPKHSYRLPTEAEWEYACRAGTQTRFWHGDKLHVSLANYDSEVSAGRVPEPTYKCEPRRRVNTVGSYGKSPWGLYDMHGNVWELCWDTWHENGYSRAIDHEVIRTYDELKEGIPSSADDPSYRSKRGGKVVRRGGSWREPASHCRSANRSRVDPDQPLDDTGFRVVFELSRPEYFQNDPALGELPR